MTDFINKLTASSCPEAFGAPGIAPRWTSSSKDGLGTAYSTASRVWFTLSHGILNEIYYPTIDSPQTRDFQFLITDGQTFFHEEKRDLKNTVEYIHKNTLGYRVVSTDPGNRYQLIKEIIADPHQPCVLIRVQIKIKPKRYNLKRKGNSLEEVQPQVAPLEAAPLQIYALCAPHLGGGGWGNSSQSVTVSGRRLLVAWKGSTYLALGVNTGFLKTSCGYVGTSDGWQDVKNHKQMTWEFDRAKDGNIAVIGQVDLSKGCEFTVGLAFGESFSSAVATLFQSMSIPYNHQRDKYIEQWHRKSRDLLALDRFSGDRGRLYRISRNLLLAHEDKTFAGAFVASASIPWGEAKGDEDLGGYHLVWTRDMVQTASALLACGDKVSPQRALVYLACVQRPDGGFFQNFWIDGTPYWGGIQLDEVAFPILLAWRLWKFKALRDFNPEAMVRRATAFLIRQGPVTDQERWEENSGYSPSTLAATIAALICAADLFRSWKDESTALFVEAYADFLESHLETWTVTTQGDLVPGISRHYIRICPPEIENGALHANPNTAVLSIRNQAPGEPCVFPAKHIIDAGFLELVRYGIRRPDDPCIEASLQVVDTLLKVNTPYGPCWRRYNHDGYGDGPKGEPFRGWGQGRAWPLLAGERAHYELARGGTTSRGTTSNQKIRSFLRAMEGFASEGGMLPEQVWDENDRPEIWKFLGRPTGSAMPLMWAHAEYIKLLRSVSDGQVFDRIEPVAARYSASLSRRQKGQQKALEVWKPNHPVDQVPAGTLLRFQAPGHFRFHGSLDGWQTIKDVEAKATSLGISFVDVAVPKDQRAPLQFTFFWTEAGRWEGRDYEVKVCNSGGK